MLRRLEPRRSAVLLALVIPALAGCASILPPGIPQPDPKPVTSTSPPPPEPTKQQDQPKKETALKAPAAPCRVLNARTRATLGLKKAERDKRDAACQWSNDPGTSPPFSFRDLKVTYDPGFAGLDTEEYAKESFERKRTSDFRQPSVFGGAPARKGTIKQVGRSDAGTHFDEGYYVFFTYQVAGASRGEGRAVLRKDNMVITISASGADVPGRSVREGRPIGNATAQRMIDAVADQVLAALR